jgi:hypothetical protein
LQHSHWVYRNQPCSFLIEKMPIYLERVTEEGDLKAGKVTFKSTSQYDEVWGSDVKFDVTWELADRMTYNHGKKVRETIKMFNAIDIVVIDKKTEWVRSHEFTYWYGQKKQIIQKRFYSTQIIHGVMLCDQSSRVFETHAVIITSLFTNYEQLILDSMRSLKCHEL